MRALNHGQVAGMDVLDPTAHGLLAEGRLLHVGVLTTNGPHVTPELYAVVRGDLWFATAATTLKARVIRRQPRISGMVRAGSRSLVVTGEATDYDVADPMRLASQARDAFRALQALGLFTVRNAADLGAFAVDLASGRLPSRRPPRRVLVRLRPDRWARLDGTRLEATGGDWTGHVTAPDQTPALEGDRDAVLGWDAPGGVVVLPARAADSEARATVPAVLAQLSDVTAETSSPACLVVDDYNRPGPAAKAGVLLRGTGTVTYDGALGRVALDVERETTWDGAETRTETRAVS
jgi:hypothetical protein